MPRPMGRLPDREISPVNTEFFLIEFGSELILPLPDKAGGADNQDAPSSPATIESSQQEPNLDSLAQPDIIRDKPVILIRRHDSVDNIDLVWQRVDIHTVKRSSNLVPGIESVCQGFQAKAFCRIVIPFFRPEIAHKRAPKAHQVFIWNPTALARLVPLNQHHVTAGNTPCGQSSPNPNASARV